jgi:hypothetical protein
MAWLNVIALHRKGEIAIRTTSSGIEDADITIPKKLLLSLLIHLYASLTSPFEATSSKKLNADVSERHYSYCE